MYAGNVNGILERAHVGMELLPVDMSISELPKDANQLEISYSFPPSDTLVGKQWVDGIDLVFPNSGSDCHRSISFDVAS